MPSHDNQRGEQEEWREEGAPPSKVGRIEALSGLTSLAFEGRVDDLIEESLRITRDLLGADSARLYEWDAETRNLSVRAINGESPPDATLDRAPLEASSAASRVLVDDGTPVVVVVDFEEEADAGRLPAFDDTSYRSGVDARISGADGICGLLSVRSKQPGAFEADEAAFVSALANIIASVTASTHQVKRLRQDLSACRQITRARNESLSMVSHDLRGPASAVKLGLEVIRRAVSGDLGEVSSDQLDAAIERANDNLRRMLDRIDELIITDEGDKSGDGYRPTEPSSPRPRH